MRKRPGGPEPTGRALPAWFGALAVVPVVVGGTWWAIGSAAPARAHTDSHAAAAPASPASAISTSSTSSSGTSTTNTQTSTTAQAPTSPTVVAPSASAAPAPPTAPDVETSLEAALLAQRILLAAPRTNVHTNPIPRLVRSGPTTRPQVAITIDDVFGANGGLQLAQVLDIAEAKGVRLTLFPTGGALQDALSNGQQEIWRRAVRDGDEIGNHTFTHANVTRLSDQQIVDEVTRTQDMLNQVLGPDYDYKLRLFRPPGGAGGYETNGNTRVMADLDRLGYSMVMWGIDSNNTGGFESYLEKIVSRAGARNGSIILCHFTTFSPANLSALIDRLRTEQLEPVTVSELFAEPAASTTTAVVSR